MKITTRVAKIVIYEILYDILLLLYLDMVKHRLKVKWMKCERCGIRTGKRQLLGFLICNICFQEIRRECAIGRNAWNNFFLFFYRKIFKIKRNFSWSEMCKKLRYNGRRIDECLRDLIKEINDNGKYKTLSCCCGHGKYNPTIIVEDRSGNVFEYYTKMILKKPKRNRFYKRDKHGYYHVNLDLIDVDFTT